MCAIPQDKRRRILDAAVVVFAEHGFYNAKVAQIAKEAGVADGTIYLYFKNKEDILTQVFNDCIDAILEQQLQMLAQVDAPEDRLRAFIRTHFMAVGQSRALAEVITVELRQSSKFMRNTNLKPFGHYLGVIARIVDDGIRRGVFNTTVNSRLVARAVFGALDELALEWAMEDQKTSLEDASHQVAELLLAGLVTRPAHTH